MFIGLITYDIIIINLKDNYIFRDRESVWSSLSICLDFIFYLIFSIYALHLLLTEEVASNRHRRSRRPWRFWWSSTRLHPRCSLRTNAGVGFGWVLGEGGAEGAVAGEEGERRRRQEQAASSLVGRRPSDLHGPGLPSSCEEEDNQYHHP